MAVLKLSTPGVYVQEISSMPPSVAEVETAIPAFIGYTEKAQRLSAGDLSMIPTKINNLAEFELYFGGAPIEAADSISITVNDDGSGQYEVKFDTDETKRWRRNLYYSLKHFYSNGGGTCYIVSVNDPWTASKAKALKTIGADPADPVATADALADANAIAPNALEQHYGDGPAG